MRLTALWWWIDRWRKSTAYTDMTLEEQGAYRNLLDEAHLRGGFLPDDERILAKACGDALAWKRVRRNVLQKFSKTSRGLHNETLVKVMEESARRSQKQAEYRAKLDNAAGNGTGNATGNTEAPPVPVLVPSSSSGSGSKKEQKKKAVPSAHSREKSPRTAEQNVKVITKIAHEVLNENGHAGNADAVEAIKTLCARRHIAYNAEVVRKALDSAEAQTA